MVTASFSDCTLVKVGTFTFMQYKNDSLSLILKSRPERAEEIEPCVMLSEQQNPPLIPLNSALFHVATEQVHAKKAWIKATTALKQTVRYQLVHLVGET